MTQSIPVNSELVGNQNNVQISVISDFNIEQNVNRPLDLLFTPLGVQRVSNMVSNYDMTHMDLNIRWLSEEGNSEILVLPAGKKANIKIVFTRKSELNLENINDEGIAR